MIDFANQLMDISWQFGKFVLKSAAVALPPRISHVASTDRPMMRRLRRVGWPRRRTRVVMVLRRIRVLWLVRALRVILGRHQASTSSLARPSRRASYHAAGHRQRRQADAVEPSRAGQFRCCQQQPARASVASVAGEEHPQSSVAVQPRLGESARTV